MRTKLVWFILTSFAARAALSASIGAQRPIQDGPEPFSGTPIPTFAHPANFILRSSDEVDFHVHKDMLRLVSGFFADMLAFPRGNIEGEQLVRDSKSVLTRPEPNAVLHGLLHLAHPPQSVMQYRLHTADFDTMVSVYDAAQCLLEGIFDNPTLLHRHRLYAISRLRDLPALARKAELGTLQYPMCPPPLKNLLTWANHGRMNVDEDRRASESYQSCGLTARDIMDDYAVAPCIVPPSHLRSPNTNKTLACGSSWKHLKRLRATLLIQPSHETVLVQVLNVAAVDRAIIESCPVCSATADRDLASFAPQLAKDIESQVFRAQDL
ncbi:hypothetical protein DFH09DRAFT_1275422 [Mycena vulgaris]|nr:hypothetical protein DFH09DRAFT_1275422 [Mycena vulgaris]